MTVSPDLTIVTRAAGRQLVLVNRSGKRRKFKLQDPDVIRAEAAQLADHIATFRDGMGGDVESEPARAAEQLKGMHEAAAGFLAAILDGPYDEFDSLCDFARRSCRTWPSARPRRPVVHIVSDLEYHIPWELVPLFDHRRRVAAATLPELLDAVSHFPAFGAVVDRRIPDPVDHSDILDANGYLQIRFFRDATYQGANSELGFFYSCGESVRVEGPYPTGVTEEDGPTVGEQLRDPTRAVTGGVLDRPDQVVHFSCHCEAGQQRGWHDYQLRLGADEQRLQWLKLFDLHNDIRRARPWDHPDRNRTMPMVFVNACASAVVDPRTAASVLKPFAKNQNRALIGTMARVPDRVAARFSRSFYQFLFGGDGLGVALHRARRQLLEDAANPLGLLYVHFGDAGLHVAPVIAPVSHS